MEITLLHTGPGYTGIDQTTGELVRARTGCIITVSPTKAAQLLADFPHEWQAFARGEAATDPTTPGKGPAITKPRRVRRTKGS